MCGRCARTRLEETRGARNKRSSTSPMAEAVLDWGRMGTPTTGAVFLLLGYKTLRPERALGIAPLTTLGRRPASLTLILKRGSVLPICVFSGALLRFRPSE